VLCRLCGRLSVAGIKENLGLLLSQRVVTSRSEATSRTYRALAAAMARRISRDNDVASIERNLRDGSDRKIRSITMEKPMRYMRTRFTPSVWLWLEHCAHLR
jgi:GH35 family endo-1,4-beta-xylanase